MLQKLRFESSPNKEMNFEFGVYSWIKKMSPKNRMDHESMEFRWSQLPTTQPFSFRFNDQIFLLGQLWNWTIPKRENIVDSRNVIHPSSWTYNRFSLLEIRGLALSHSGGMIGDFNGLNWYVNPSFIFFKLWVSTFRLKLERRMIVFSRSSSCVGIVAVDSHQMGDILHQVTVEWWTNCHQRRSKKWSKDQ